MPLLVEQFIDKYTRTLVGLEKHVGRPDPLVRSGVSAITSAARLGDKILFTDSTMAMLVDKLRHFDETVEELLARFGGSVTYDAVLQRARAWRGGWIEFPRPFANSPVDDSLSRWRNGDQVSAMLAFVPSIYVPRTGRDTLQVHLISPDADVTDVICELPPGNRWAYETAYHRCPACTYQSGQLLPCDRCRSLLNTWGKIFGLSAIIAGQYLAAMRYETVERQTMRRVPRAKAGGKEKRIHVKHIFRVIDANEILIPVFKEEDAPTRPTPGSRESWVLDEDVIREEIRTRPFTRTYRSARYVNVRGLTREFPEGITRLQPKKVGNLGKVVTRVKASLYEERNEDRPFNKGDSTVTTTTTYRPARGPGHYLQGHTALRIPQARQQEGLTLLRQYVAAMRPPQGHEAGWATWQEMMLAAREEGGGRLVTLPILLEYLNWQAWVEPQGGDITYLTYMMDRANEENMAGVLKALAPVVDHGGIVEFAFGDTSADSLTVRMMRYRFWRGEAVVVEMARPDYTELALQRRIRL